MKLDYAVIDADNHYYEPVDAFARFIDPKMRDRAVAPKRAQNGALHVMAAGERPRFASVWPSELGGRPGSLVDYFTGKGERRELLEDAIIPTDFPEFMERGARLAAMDAQGVQAVIMQPSLALSVEPALRKDPTGLYANISAYNRWLGSEWGFGADGRIFGVAWLSLVDPEAAARELDSLLSQGVRAVFFQAGPVDGRSLADPRHDPVWARLSEAGTIVVFHVGDAGYGDLFFTPWGQAANPPFHRMSALECFLGVGERPVVDTLAAVILGGLFERFPGLRVISAENGSGWVHHFLHGLDKAYREGFGRSREAGQLKRLPSEAFREHVWVAPFYEDDIESLVRTLGVDHVLFGSDYPHPEGTALPLDFADYLTGLTDTDVRKVMRGNSAGLLGLPA